MKKNSVFVILGILAGLNILAWIAVYDLSRPQPLEVTFFDVGQGDAVFIVTPQGHQILIDGGPFGEAILEKLGKEMPFWDRTIDLIVLTHPHDDHLAGLIDVIQRYHVENILWTGVIEDSAAFREWQGLILESEAKIVIARAGQRIKGKNFSVDVLYPFFSLEGQEFKDANLSSLVLRLVFGDNAFLFTGDAYKSMERELIAKEIFCREEESFLCRVMVLDADVLMAGHHGSKTSSAREFIARVLPEIVVISAGKNNPHGHPHPETLETLAEYGVKVLRTDLHGDIKIFSNGIRYGVR